MVYGYLVLTRWSLRFLWRWKETNGGLGQIWFNAWSFWMRGQWSLRMLFSGERSLLYGMINGNECSLLVSVCLVDVV